MLKLIHKTLQWFFMRVEGLFNVAFGDKLNPLYHLGTITFFQFWLDSISGLYLYIFMDTGVTDAYLSMERLTHKQWWLGGIMRSIHRYASDGMVLTMLLHMVRHFSFDQCRSFRWFPWATGIILIWKVYISDIHGSILPWTFPPASFVSRASV